MLKTRVIPTLLWKDFGLVKGVNFDHGRRVGSVITSVRVYNSRDVDEIILMDISCTNESRVPDFESIADFAEDCFVPLTVGGGIKSSDEIRSLLHAGADKVCINSAAYDNPELITMAADKFGSQCIVVGIDVKQEEGGDFVCYKHSGKQQTSQNAIEWAVSVEKFGAGEILLTSIDRDGTLSGFDLNLISAISNAVNIPVIASGGASCEQDLVNAVQKGASAVAAGAIFHFTEITPHDCKIHMAKNGIPVRLNN
jgi:cyclase